MSTNIFVAVDKWVKQLLNKSVPRCSRQRGTDYGIYFIVFETTFDVLLNVFSEKSLELGFGVVSINALTLK